MMPGTPTSPDNLTTILDTDSPDIPRDMNNLANSTQAALLNRATSAQAILDAHIAAARPHPNFPVVDNLGAGMRLLVANQQVTVGAGGRTNGVNLSAGGIYTGTCPFVVASPYQTASRIAFAVTNAEVNNIIFAVYIDNTLATQGTVLLLSILAFANRA